MRITSRAFGEIRVVDLDGNMKTPSDMEDFTSFIEKELEGDQKKFILNFKLVHFINSSGLGRLILALKKISEKKGSLGVINLNTDVDELFTITRIKEKIPVFADEATALERLK
jgi:anti-anti-sigma factor